ncbi:MAG: hypothetical protein ACO33A_07400 [Hyphomonas sp.]
MIRILALAAIALAAPLAGFADEVWSLPSGNQIVYDRDTGDTAVLSYMPERGLEKGWIFVPGLAGVYEGRATYQGYWVEPAEAGAACPAALIDAEGTAWARWGAIEIKFVKPTFPSKIKIKRTNCFRPAETRLTAKPVIGAGLQ